MKAYGKEIKEFHASRWEDLFPGKVGLDPYIDAGGYFKVGTAEEFDDLGVDTSELDDTEKYEIVGEVRDQSGKREHEDFSISLVTLFRRWRAVQTTTLLQIQVPKDKLDEVQAALVPFGVKILK